MLTEIMDIGIADLIIAVWAAWNFWSIVMVVVVILMGFVIWKVVITPKEYQERLAWEQQKENRRLTQTKIRRFLTTVLIGLFSLAGSVVFCIAVYKMFE